MDPCLVFVNACKASNFIFLCEKIPNMFMDDIFSRKATLYFGFVTWVIVNFRNNNLCRPIYG